MWKNKDRPLANMLTECNLHREVHFSFRHPQDTHAAHKHVKQPGKSLSSHHQNNMMVKFRGQQNEGKKEHIQR